MQYQILKFYQSIQNPVLSFFANLLSFFGEEVALIVVAIIFLYGIDKKKTFAFVNSMVLALIGTNGLKAIFRSPRPFVKHADLIADRVETAGGYSFPSGHTTTASSFYISFAKVIGKKSLLIVAFILAGFVGLSRNYLLVHWPIDLLVGYIIGTLFAFIITPFSLKLYDDKQKFGLFCIITSIITGLFSLIIAPLMTFNIVDTLAFSSLADMCEIATGLYFGFFLEEKFIDFKECKNLKGTIINLLGCGALIGVIYFIASFIPDKYIRHLFRNTLLGFSASYLYPLLASKLGILKKNEKN